MITGTLKTLSLATLPRSLWLLLSRAEYSLEALQARSDGKIQPEGASWFCTIAMAQTALQATRHTEFHRQYLDIQIVLEGEEIIWFSCADARQHEAEERKPDLFIVKKPQLTQSLHLRTGDFVTFSPGEAHQALCAVTEPTLIRKAVFKIPLSMLEAEVSL